jgi:hypothetical protein
MTPEHLKKELRSSLGRVRDAFIIAFIGMLVSIPAIKYQAPFFFHKYFERNPSPEGLNQFFLEQLIILLSTLLIIVMVGNLANRRAGLKPFAWPGHKRVWPMIVLGMALIPAAYLLSDHLLLGLVPEVYPAKLGYALLYPISNSFPDELFVRYGFLGLAAWLLKKVKGGKALANLFIAALFTLFDFYDTSRSADASFQPLEVAFLMTGALIEHLIAGSLYLKYGFWSALAFRFGLDLKYLLYYFMFF